MSKLILCLLLLLNIYICEEPPKGIRVFEKNNRENKIKVRLGEEFVLKFVNHPGIGFRWRLVNEDEIKETVQFLRKYEGEQYGRIAIIGNPRNVYYQFKALKQTNETVIAKFYYGKYEKTDLRKITVFKINVE